MVSAQIFDDKSVAVRLYLQAGSLQPFMQGLPVLGALQGITDFFLMALGIELKRLLSGLRLNGGDFVTQAVFADLLKTVIHGKAVLLLQLTAGGGKRFVIEIGRVPGQGFRVDHVI